MALKERQVVPKPGLKDKTAARLLFIDDCLGHWVVIA